MFQNRVLTVVLLFLFLPTPASPRVCQQHEYAGAYKVEDGRYLIIRSTESGALSIIDMRTGQVRNLTLKRKGLYTHGPTRSRGTPVVGHVSFGPGRQVTWTSSLFGKLVGTPLPAQKTDLLVKGQEGAVLSGTLFLPERGGSYPVAVIIPLGDRSSLWEPAMWLLTSGIGVFVYDQRGTGNSTGKLYGEQFNSHTLESLQFAGDVVTIIRKVRSLPGVDPHRIGILGWSQGGWVGAMAASRLGRQLAFYVNIAANASPWPEQAQHRFLSRLRLEGFSGTALEEAAEYFQALRAVSDFRIGWQEYRKIKDLYKNSQWYRTIIGIFPFFAYDEYGEALVGWSMEKSPDIYFRRLSEVPSLGVYFEFDQSNPPDSPSLFVKALEEAGNSNFCVKEFSGVNHGGWVVTGYAFNPENIDRRDPDIFNFVGNWIAAQVRIPTDRKN